MIQIHCANECAHSIILFWGAHHCHFNRVYSGTALHISGQLVANQTLCSGDRFFECPSTTTHVGYNPREWFAFLLGATNQATICCCSTSNQVINGKECANLYCDDNQVIECDSQGNNCECVNTCRSDLTVGPNSCKCIEQNLNCACHLALTQDQVETAYVVMAILIKIPHAQVKTHVVANAVVIAFVI